MKRSSYFILISCAVLSACDEGKRLGKVGDFCSDDKDCEMGLCFESQCLDPDGDEDGDGLKNGVEKHKLGTDPTKADTDGDGVNDYDELGGDINSPADDDGDGIINALESSKADADKDCLPDQIDPKNNEPDEVQEIEIAKIHCQKNGGVCKDRVEQIKARCEEGTPVCDYSEVQGYEEEETTRNDGLDNDCDGLTDEGLGKVGDPCSEDKDCMGGLCFENLCLDPDADDDGDGLKNGVEKHMLGTNPRKADTDGDGLSDYDEVGGDTNQPRDQDGDGIIDALESATEDPDKDCLPDQFDPNNNQPDQGMGKQIAKLHCATVGVCKDFVDEASATCVDGQALCKYETISVYEQTERTCDGLDNDCDGETDEGLDGTPCEITNDYGTCVGNLRCKDGKSTCEGQEPAKETCDGVDNDCDGETDEDFPYLGETCKVGTGACSKEGTVVCSEDGLGVICDAKPGTPSDEVCDGIDNDCDGETDEDIIGERCLITNEYGSCPGETRCAGGGMFCDGRAPEPESCNGVDDNCDGTTDEGFPDRDDDGLADCIDPDIDGDNIPNQQDNCPAVFNPSQEDLDADGIGDACDPDMDNDGDPNETDCNPKDPSVFHGAIEWCNNTDDNCDGKTDEPFVGLGEPCTAGVGACMREGKNVCAYGGDRVICDATPGDPTKEICNGVDDDCDGMTDEDNVCPPGTATIKGRIYDAESLAPLEGVTIRLTAPSTLGINQNLPQETKTDAKGLFVLKADPTCFDLWVENQGYQVLKAKRICFGTDELRPLELAIVRQDSSFVPLNVCGRVYQYGCKTTQVAPLPYATVMVYAGFQAWPPDTTLGIGVADNNGYYCVSGLPAKDASGKVFARVDVGGSQFGYWPFEPELTQFTQGEVVLRDLSLSKICEDYYRVTVLFSDGFDGFHQEWVLDNQSSDTGWHFIEDGTRINSAIGVCTAKPGLAEACAPGEAGCLACRPDGAGCLPESGSLPSPFFGSGALWFGNDQTNNFLSGNAVCEQMDGGSGERVSGTAYSPWASMTARPQSVSTTLILTFAAAWEVESVGLSQGNDRFEVSLEAQNDQGEKWSKAHVLTPISVLPFEPSLGYSSAGLGRPPYWGVFGMQWDIPPEWNATRVRVVFSFDSQDGYSNGFRGVLVDQVQLTELVPRI